MHNKPQNVDFSPSTLSCMSASPSAWQPIGTSCHVRPSVSWVTNMSRSLGRAWRTCPPASQATVEPLEWTVGEVSGLWLNWFWILAKHIFHMFILLFFSSSHGVKKKNPKSSLGEDFLFRSDHCAYQEAVVMNVVPPLEHLHLSNIPRFSSTFLYQAGIVKLLM